MSDLNHHTRGIIVLPFLSLSVPVLSILALVALLRALLMPCCIDTHFFKKLQCVSQKEAAIPFCDSSLQSCISHCEKRRMFPNCHRDMSFMLYRRFFWTLHLSFFQSLVWVAPYTLALSLDWFDSVLLPNHVYHQLPGLISVLWDSEVILQLTMPVTELSV